MYHGPNPKVVMHTQINTDPPPDVRSHDVRSDGHVKVQVVLHLQSNTMTYTLTWT